MAMEAQEEHRESSGWEGMIYDFLEKKVPVSWDKMDVSARKMYLQGNTRIEEPLVSIDKVCVNEIWVECLGGDQRYLKQQDRTKINNILRRLQGWEKTKTPARFGPYGTSRGYLRK